MDIGFQSDKKRYWYRNLHIPELFSAPEFVILGLREDLKGKEERVRIDWLIRVPIAAQGENGANNPARITGHLILDPNHGWRIMETETAPPDGSRNSEQYDYGPDSNGLPVPHSESSKSIFADGKPPILSRTVYTKYLYTDAPAPDLTIEGFLAEQKKRREQGIPADEP